MVVLWMTISLILTNPKNENYPYKVRFSGYENKQTDHQKLMEILLIDNQNSPNKSYV